MDIKEYSYILALVKYRNLTDAAKSLYISQPSLSIYIKNLEKRIGIKLFYKVSGELHLTYAGKRYIDYAKKISDLDASLDRELEAIRTLNGGEIVLGITPTRATYILPLLLPKFHKKYPGIRIRLIENAHERLEEMIETRQVDLAILGELPPRSSCFNELFTDKICVTIPASDPVCEKGILLPGETLPWIDMKLLADKPFILLMQGQRIREISDELFRQAGFEPNILYETKSSITAHELSSASIGISIVSDNFCRHYEMSNLRYFLTGDPIIERKVVVAYESRERLSNSALAMLTMLEEERNLFL